jgi:phosphatidate cytidylyltransferase
MTRAHSSFNLIDLGPRAASALVMICAALLTNVLGGVCFAMFWLVAACAIFWEWTGLVQSERSRWLLLTGMVTLVLIAFLSFDGLVTLALCVLAVSVFVIAVLAPTGQRLWIVCGLAYASSLIFSTFNLRFSGNIGQYAILWLFAVVWGTDIMAYFAGRLVGGPKLWPRVSPSKTWSGFLCGIFCGACAGFLVVPDHVTALLFSLGLCAGAVAQGGDLFESSMKRRFGVKDSSRLIPGHGGVMDRLDGFITASFFAFIIGLWHSGFSAPSFGLLNW